MIIFDRVDLSVTPNTLQTGFCLSLCLLLLLLQTELGSSSFSRRGECDDRVSRPVHFRYFPVYCKFYLYFTELAFRVRSSSRSSDSVYLFSVYLFTLPFGRPSGMSPCLSLVVPCLVPLYSISVFKVFEVLVF